MYLVGDADRERTLERLRGHYLDGRLSIEEFEDRAGLLARARTTRELRLALRGLPYRLVESEFLPRLVALSESPVDRRILRVSLAVTLLALRLSLRLAVLVVLVLAWVTVRSVRLSLRASGGSRRRGAAALRASGRGSRRERPAPRPS